MFRNYLTVAFRHLIRHKLYSAINVVGLAVGLAACVLIMLFVRDEFSFDTFWQDADRIYRLNTTFAVPGREPFVTVVAQGPTKEALKRYFPEEIAYSTRLTQNDPVITYRGESTTEEIYWTDPETADIFSLDVVRGDLKASLHDNATLAVNESFARKYFGDADPIGQVMTLTFFTTTRDYRIGAVFRDLPHNTVLNFQALAMIDEKDFVDFPWLYDQWFSVNNSVFFKLKDGVAPETVASRLADFTDAVMQAPGSLGPDVRPSDISIHTMQALTDIQLHPTGGGEMKPTSDIRTVMIFIAIAGLILLIACINFMNLATAKSTQRAREVALRKVLGAYRSQLIAQFLGESVLIALVGLTLGIVLVEMTVPFYGAFLGRELHFDYTDGTTLAILAGLVVTVGLVGGAYPALVLSRFRPARVLKANKSAETPGSSMLRNGLVVLQFTISIALLIATAVVYGQMLFGTNMDPGFKKENMLVLTNMQRQGVIEKHDAIKEAVRRLPGVKSASLSTSQPVSGDESNTSVSLPDNPDVGSILLGYQGVDHDFLDTYNIPLLAGRNYDRNRVADGRPSPEGVPDGTLLNGTMIVNEGALRRFGYGSPAEAIGKAVTMGGDRSRGVLIRMEIIGVVPDIHFQSLRSVLRPEMYILDSRDVYSALTISFDGDPQALVSAVEGIWKQFVPAVPFAYEFVDEAMAEEFEAEKGLAAMLGAFSVLAVLVACLGLFGLASFAAERRTKEIGIRKVMGATVFDIVRLLLWQFSKPVLIANLIAWPIAAWGTLAWLENFPYRLDAWILVPLCLFSGLAALMIAWLTVGGNAARVARSNPIKALRYE